MKGLRACFVLVFLVLFGKLWYIAVLKSDYYKDLAKQNQIRIIRLLAPRGLLLDREGRVLVDNVESVNLVLFLDKADDLEEVFEFLRGLDMTEEELNERMQAARRHPKYQGLTIKENLSMAEVSYVLAHQNEHPELTIVEEPRRLYRYGELAAHALGYVGEISARQLEQPEFKGYHQGDIIGKCGVERTYNRNLSGKDGQRRLLVNSLGRAIEELHSIEAIPGKSLSLTLDLDLQMVAEAALGDSPGAVVAFDPIHGDILVMASRPAFDPNLFATRISRQDWVRLSNDPNHPLQNRVIQAEFSPGSTFKLIMAIAGLESGVVNENDTVFCPGGISLYGHYFHCWKPGGHGRVNLSDAIRQSCNVYFYTLGQKLGIGQIEHYSKLLGLGQFSGVDLFGESVGLVPSEQWKERTKGEKWYAGETISVAIGQGAMNVTPMQLARAVGMIATGQAPPLRLVKDKRVYRPPATAVATSGSVPIFHEKNLQAVRNGMWRVVNEYGTGRAAMVRGFEVCGKTGTAQTISKAARAKLPPEVAAKFPSNAWFVGFAPRDNPEIVVCVIVQGGDSGGGVAAPVAGKIFQAYFDKKYQRPQQPEPLPATPLQVAAVTADATEARVQRGGINQ
ncbi:MAG TPA: penicillin-binding protein 2 [Acidobacteriota bacterium]|nr:penicillin-binding protein 2 [Acidobacteriota bacterium]